VLLSAFFTLALFTDFLLFEVAFCLGFSLLEVFFGGCSSSLSFSSSSDDSSLFFFSSSSLLDSSDRISGHLVHFAFLTIPELFRSFLFPLLEFFLDFWQWFARRLWMH
jgi:hypothetical protein